MADDSFGPFSVAPGSISRLGRDFAPFVNELLRVEAADARLAGGSLVTTSVENAGDGGVDAYLDSDTETRYLPKGKSAWQFKAGDLLPAKCTEELRNAGHALDILHDGGRYLLVVGADINAMQIARRRKALEEEARAQGIAVGRDTVTVLNASHLAEWAGEHPSLAVSPLLGGLTHAVLGFTAWSGSSGLADSWVANDAAGAVAAAVDKAVTGTGPAALHVRGVSGLGKTRSVLEALRGKPCEPLVAYVHAADDLPSGLVYQLQRQERHAILVVDGCDARTHEALSRKIPVGSKVRLITIGTPSGYRPATEVQEVGPVDDASVREILRLNRPALPPEAAPVVVAAAAGNVKLALLLASDLLRRPVPAAADLITPEIIESYVTRSLPTGKGLLACAALALFTSVGFDLDAVGELEALAAGLGFSAMDLKAAAEDLNRDGLISRLGRFRAVTPHPLAIYLAKRGWEQFGGQITANLLLSLGRPMTVRLLQRATDIGESGPVRHAVTQMLGPGGPFERAGTAQDNQSDVLPYLAVLAPQTIASRLAAMLTELRDTEREAVASQRPDVTWALEKLAWHGDTFRQAADGLLSLAAAAGARHDRGRADNWCDLFGILLPTTSASPATRIQYLARKSRDPDRRVRRLAVAAAARACSLHETVSMSAALQGGFLVATRGLPATWGDAWEYSGAALDILADLAGDVDAQVADEAVGVLVAMIHPYLESEPLRARLAGAITRMPAAGLTKARTQIGHLRALFERTGANFDTADRQVGLEALEALLPTASAEEEFDALAHASRWDRWPGNQLQQQLNDAALAIPVARRSAHILRAVTARPAAAFELGATLSRVATVGEDALGELVTQAAVGNFPPLAGYLHDRVGKGEPDAFDDLLDSSRSATLDDEVRLAVSVYGPQTDRAWQRVERLARRLPPAQGTRRLLGWHPSLETERLRPLLADWMNRLSSQADYNAVVDFTAVVLHQQPWQAEIDLLVAELVGYRTRYPDVGNQEPDWTALAGRQLDHEAGELLETLLILLENGNFRPFVDTEEAQLLRNAVGKGGLDGWRKAMSRLAASPRMLPAFRGWLAGAAGPTAAGDWVGTDLTRARQLAQVATPGGDSTDPVARLLLTGFGGDPEVASALRMAYTVGTSRGSYSARCQAQIRQLTGWVNSPAEPQQVRDWAQAMIAALTAERDRALQSEAEYGL